MQETSQPWSTLYRLYWQMTLALALPLPLAWIFGGNTLKACAVAFWAASLVSLVGLRRWPRLAVGFHQTVALIITAAQLLAPPTSVLPGLPEASWRLAIAVFTAIGVYSQGLFLGWWGVMGATLIYLLAPTIVLPERIPLLTGLILAGVAGVGVNRLMHRLEVAQKRLTQAALNDPLTGLGNRRALELDYERYGAIARRQGLSLVLSLWDLDGLKQINDTQGHSEGDRYIQQFTEALRAELREGDALFRLGGDEFCGLHLGLIDGAAPAERVRRRFPQVSVGFAEASKQGLTAALEQADRAMYVHKHRKFSSSKMPTGKGG